MNLNTFTLNGELVIISRRNSASKHKSAIKTSFFSTLRFRIVVIMLVLSIIPSVIITNAICSTYMNLAVSSRIAIVRNQCIMLNNQIASGDYLSNTTNPIINSEIDMLTSIYGGRIQIIDDNMKIVKDSFGLDSGKYLLSSAVINCFKGQEYSNNDEDNSIVELALRITDPSSNDSDAKGVMLISFSTREITSNYSILQRNALIVLGIIVVMIIVFGLLFSGILVRPFKKITNAINSLMLEPIHVNDYEETRQISDAFNRLIVQVKDQDDNRQEFVSNVSHELKTPLASMKVLADSLNMNPEASVEQFREFMKDISEEIDRENAIITDLLSLVSMDKNADDMHVENTNINEIVELVVKRLRPIADIKNVELITDSFKTVEAEVDPTKITLVISNIVENGIKYNKPEGGWVRISLNADHKYFYLTISDSGIGMPQDATEKIFERFYRVDKSHSREIGGTGLGLAIVKGAITMHKGMIRVSSVENEGSTFSIRIPLVHVA